MKFRTVVAALAGTVSLGVGLGSGVSPAAADEPGSLPEPPPTSISVALVNEVVAGTDRTITSYKEDRCVEVSYYVIKSPLDGSSSFYKCPVLPDPIEILV